MYNNHIDKVTERTNFNTYSTKDAIIDYIVVECILNVENDEKRNRLMRIVESYIANEDYKYEENVELMLDIASKVGVIQMMALQQMRERGIIDELYHISQNWRNLYDSES